MESRRLEGIDFSGIKTPAYVVDKARLEENCRIMQSVGEESGATLLLALKGFSMFSLFGLMRPFLQGVCASSPHEARLGREEMGKEVHSYSPAYSENSLRELMGLSDHVVFNSPSQWNRFASLRKEYAGRVSCGIRYNPSHSESETPIYDPSAPLSRLGTIREELPRGFLREAEGLHLHNLCEKNAPELVRTWEAAERVLRSELDHLNWINLGGGHHITRDNYRRDLLIELIREIRSRYGVQVYLEPGEAWALNAGFLVTTILDTHRNRGELAIMDTSVPCHMPDVLEMPYRPEIIGAARPGEKPYTYRLGGVSCLAGDAAGDYSFDSPLKTGGRLVFTDMAHYTMVKANTFNGVNLPSLYVCDSRDGSMELIKHFGYADFKDRLS